MPVTPPILRGTSPPRGHQWVDGRQHEGYRCGRGPILRGAGRGDLQTYTVYVAGIAASSKQADAAKALIAFLSSAPVKAAKGFEPR